MGQVQSWVVTYTSCGQLCKINITLNMRTVWRSSFIKWPNVRHIRFVIVSLNAVSEFLIIPELLLFGWMWPWSSTELISERWRCEPWAPNLKKKKTQKVFFTFVCKNFSFLNRATKTPKEITKILNWTLNIFTSLICLLKSNYSTVASHQVIHHYTQDSPTSLTLQMLLSFSFPSLFMLSKL